MLDVRQPPLYADTGTRSLHVHMSHACELQVYAPHCQYATLSPLTMTQQRLNANFSVGVPINYDTTTLERLNANFSVGVPFSLFIVGLNLV